MVRRLFLSLSFLLFPLLGFAQQAEVKQREEYLYWESVLDAYEAFADAREQMRGTRKSAESLREIQLRIEELLRHPKGKMTLQQQRRFNAISLLAGLPVTVPAVPEDSPQTVSAEPVRAEQPPARQVPSVKPQQAAAGPSREPPLERVAGQLPEGRISWTPRRQVSVPALPKVRPGASGTRPHWQYYILLRTGFSPKWQLGLMAGALHPSGLGCYASWRMHPAFNRQGETYVATHPEMLWTNGKSSLKGQSAHAGLLAGKGPLVFYAGAGYGSRTVFWQDSDGAWAQIPSASVRGLSLEAGGMVELGRLCLSLGVETLAFRTFGVAAGAGISF